MVDDNPPPAGQPKKSNLWFWGVIIVMSLLGAAIVIPNFVKARQTACMNTCVANLKQIDGAKEQWALEKQKEPKDIPTWSDLIGTAGYIKNMPTCPLNGHYTINAVWAEPTCTMGKTATPVHMLPQ
jgi:competence protein ComGC